MLREKNMTSPSFHRVVPWLTRLESWSCLPKVVVEAVPGVDGELRLVPLDQAPRGLPGSGDGEMWIKRDYPLVNIQKNIEHGHRNS